jgi:hypothetical protein
MRILLVGQAEGRIPPGRRWRNGLIVLKYNIMKWDERPWAGLTQDRDEW